MSGRARGWSFVGMTGLGIICFVALGSWALAAFTAPQSDSTGFPYEGYLEQGGVALDDVRDFEVSLYNLASGGTPLYKETHAAKPISGGYFGLTLGTGTVVSGTFASLGGANELFLSLGIKTAAEGTYTPLAGRQRLASVPYALGGAPGRTFDVRPIAYANNQSGGIQIGTTNGNWLASFALKSDAGGGVRTAIDASAGGTAGAKIEAISIDSAGNVGLGTSTPAAKLDVIGKARIDQGATYDLWLQGGTAASGVARNLALLGTKASDTLTLNFGGEYTGGVVIGSSTTVSGDATVSGTVFAGCQVITAVSAATGNVAVTAACPAGSSAIGGGATTPWTTTLVDSVPWMVALSRAAADGELPTGWRASIQGGAAGARTAYAVCCRFGN